MIRERWVLRDTEGREHAVVFAHQGEEPEVEPWMAHSVYARGWTLKKEEGGGHEVRAMHGVVNWQKVADDLAEPMRMLLSDQVELSEAEADEWMDKAQQALDAHDVAHMEVGVGLFGQTAEEPGQEDDDGGS